MTTTPADLLAAAREIARLIAIPNIVNNEQRWYEIAPLAKSLAEHILATVHFDDDEPVTVEKCDELGLPNLPVSPYHRQYRVIPGVRLMAEAYPGGFNPCELWMSGGQDFTTIKSPKMKQVRQLLSALKVEVK